MYLTNEEITVVKKLINHFEHCSQANLNIQAVDLDVLDNLREYITAFERTPYAGLFGKR